MKFHEILVQSYNSGYLKTLDTDFFFSLKSPMAKSLYQLVDAKRRGKLSWTVGVPSSCGSSSRCPRATATTRRSARRSNPASRS